jgi:hypothetical protein
VRQVMALLTKLRVGCVVPRLPILVVESKLQ